MTLTARSRGIFAIADKVPRRFPQRVGPRAAAPQLADRPVWVAAAGKGWREIAALPSLGVRGKFQDEANATAGCRPWLWSQPRGRSAPILPR